MTGPMRPLSFGEILDGAFTLYRRNFTRFLGTWALVMAVTCVVTLVLVMIGVLTAPVLHPALRVALLGPVVGTLVTLGWSSLTWQAARLYQGKPASMGDSLAVALIGALPLAGSCLIAWVLIGIAGAAGIMALPVLLSVLAPEPLLVPWAAKAFGVALPCLFMAALFFAVVPAVVLEDQGPLEAVERSVELAWGALPRIMGVLTVALAIVVLPSLAVFWLTGGFTRPASSAGLTPGGAVIEQLLSIAVHTLVAPVLPSVIVVLYYDRRMRTEPLAMEIAARQHTVAGA